ncbi:hypothetical protein EFD56_28150, partial [Rhizobium phaseoli]
LYRRDHLNWMLRHMTTPSVTTRTGSQKPSIARRPSPWAYFRIHAGSIERRILGRKGEIISATGGIRRHLWSRDLEYQPGYRQRRISGRRRAKVPQGSRRPQRRLMGFWIPASAGQATG